MKGKRKLICLVFLPELVRPFTSSQIVYWLSWYIIFLSILYPWASIKYRVCKICGNLSCVATSYSSVELFTFIFCLFELLMIAPFPSVVMAPLCPLLSQLSLYEASTHHLIRDIITTISFNFIFIVPFGYLSTLFNFPQSSSLGCLTLIIINATDVWISLRAQLHINISCAVVWWKLWACSSSRYLVYFSSITLNKCSTAGDAVLPMIFSVKYLSILPVYVIMDTLTDPYSE